MLDIGVIKGVISKIPYIKKVISLKKDEFFIYGKIEILFEGLEKPLSFKFQIFPQYPLKSYDSESIRFINKDLLKYNHVMKDGSICIHTSYNTNIRKKLLIDFNSLKSWIEKYYINNDEDKKYEHIIVSPSLIHNKYYSYIFTDVDYKFKKGDYGEVKLSLLANGIYKEANIANYLVKSFSTQNGEKTECYWNKMYKKNPLTDNGFYVFIEKHPAEYNKFAFKKFNKLETYIPSAFLDLLHKFEKYNLKNSKDIIVPMFIGYTTVESEIHWQVALLEIGNFPIKEEYEKKDKILVPIRKLTDQDIKWAITRNASYKYFFGRGTLVTKITNAKILVIGVGAIGSMIAKVLVKGGCRFVDIADYDIKEPENICRSEYLFNTGITDKVYELQQILLTNSPFVEINIFKKEYFEEIIKIFSTDLRDREHFASKLNEYDIIFDCTTDNDLMYVLNLLELNCDLINLSITNHAKELVCAFSPNIDHFVNTQFEKLLDNDIDDLYEPIGCWSPTFKASYADISVLVQMAMKQINLIYEKNKARNNFIIRTEDDNVFTVRIEEY